MSTAPSPEAPLPQPGDVVAGKYRVEAVIGTGGMGIVLGATDTSLGRAVAIKFLTPSKARREDAVQRFLREARAAAAIQSEHVVRVFEVDKLPSGTPFIVMEHLRGQDLAHLLAARGPLPIPEAVDYLLEACEALAEAHVRGIVHRDLKPQNLFVAHRPDGTTSLKVLDFGISKAAEDDQPQLTATDVVMGTPLYMSPEQVRSLKSVDQRSDIWALGSILYELVTGGAIFDAPSTTALCAMIAMDPPIPLRARKPDAPPELEAIVMRCLHKDPQGRFANVAQLAIALAPFASDRGRGSIERISRVVGGRPDAANVPTGPTPVASPAAFRTTAEAPFGAATAEGFAALRASAPPATAPSSSGYPGLTGTVPPPQIQVPINLPPTQSSWQQANAPPKKNGGAAIAIVAVIGVLLLFVAGGGAIAAFLFLRSSPADTGTPTVQAAASTTVPLATPDPTLSATSSAFPNAAKKGAASAAPAKSGAAPTAAPSATANSDFEAKKRLHTQFCSHNQFLLSQPNVNDATLHQVENSTCLPGNSPDGSSCERALCRQACSALKDSACLQRVQFADQSFPAKY
ncbi:MAG TPA: protein kinase [Labilithrix sp.]